MTILKETDSAVTIEIDGVENGRFEIVLVVRHKVPSTCLKRSSQFFRKVHDQFAHDALPRAVHLAVTEEDGDEQASGSFRRTYGRRSSDP